MAGPLGAARVARPALALEYPMSLGVFEKYDDAQRAVDYLSDQQFPVQNCMIVGTELKQIERVTGRLTYGKAAMAGAASGPLVRTARRLPAELLRQLLERTSCLGPELGHLRCGLLRVWAVVGYAATGGRRDFTSVSQVVATRYEVLVEHKLAEKARELPGQDAGRRSRRTPPDG